jgi:hypothetical protein
MAVKSMETAEEAMASMEMALGALPRPDRVPEQRNSVPRNLSLMAAALRNCSGKNADSFRVFLRKAFL